MRRVATLGVAMTAALVMSPMAVADPADDTSPSAPPPTSTSVSAPETAPEAPSETLPETPGEAPAAGPPAAPAAPKKNAAAAASIDDFAVSATFDKPSYATGEDMRITFSITNNATTAAKASASFFGQAPDLVRVRDEGDFPPGGAVTIAAGATHTTTLTGAVGNPDVTTARLRAFVSDETGAAKYFEFTVPVTPRFAHAAGTAFDDKNGDNRVDAGEELAGVTLTWRNQLYEDNTHTVTTGADGTFSLPRLPTAPYFVSGTAPDGLLVGYRMLTVGADGVDGLLFRAVRPLTDLTVDLEFTKDTYRRDETPTVRVTLTNTGDLPLTGIVANCNRSGEGPQLSGDGAGWGALSGDGVNVEPHSTTVLEVTEPMPGNAYDYGRVAVACDFGYQGVDEGNPRDFDESAVPGMRGDITGIVAHEETGLAGVRVVLVADAHCPIVAEANSGADGEFALRNVPVGNYDVYLFPPSGWHVVYDNPTSTTLVGAGPARLIIEVAAGNAELPTLPDQPADCAAGGPATTPAAQGRTAPATGLASTGASIAVPGTVGALALLAGAGVLLVTRRRRSTTG